MAFTSIKMTLIIALVLPCLLGTVFSRGINGYNGNHNESCDLTQNGGNGNIGGNGISRNGNYDNGNNGNYYNRNNGANGNNGYYDNGNNGKGIYNGNNGRNNGYNGNGRNNGYNGNGGNNGYNGNGGNNGNNGFNGNNGNGIYNGNNGNNGPNSQSRNYWGDRQGSSEPNWGQIIETPDRYEYQRVQNLSDSQQSIRFQVQANSDAYVGLHQNDDLNQNFTEILIGGWRNTRSAIRSRLQGQTVASFEHTPLDGNNFRDFWIQWDRSGNVSVGEGLDIGQRQFMTWNNDQPFPYRLLSISTGYGATGRWRFEQQNNTTTNNTQPVLRVNTTGDGNYVQLQQLSEQLRQNNGFPFYIRANGNANVLLQSREGDEFFGVYEIIFGKFGNTITEIRRGRNGQLLDWASKSISERNYLPFWISVENDTISVGDGADIGVQPFLSYTDANVFNVQYVSVATTNGTEGIWFFKAQP